MLAEIEKLMASLASSDRTQACTAAEELAGFGEEAQQAALPLLEACRADDAQLREWAVAALEQLGPPPVEDVGQLIALVNGQEELVDYWAVTLLGRLGPEAAPAAACLGHALESSPFPSVCQRAAWALRELGPSAGLAKASLEQAAASSEPRLARLAQAALGQLTG